MPPKVYVSCFYSNFLYSWCLIVFLHASFLFLLILYYWLHGNCHQKSMYLAFILTSFILYAWLYFYMHVSCFHSYPLYSLLLIVCNRVYKISIWSIYAPNHQSTNTTDFSRIKEVRIKASLLDFWRQFPSIFWKSRSRFEH